MYITVIPMSYGNAIRQREEMIQEYTAMIRNETDPTRIADIKKQIDLCKDEISQLKNGKPLFGKPTRLNQETRIITADPETKTQKVVVINPHPKEEAAPSTTETKRLGNSLRDILSAKKTNSEETLKAKIAAAKAAKK